MRRMRGPRTARARFELLLQGSIVCEEKGINGSKRETLTRIIHEASTARVDQADLTGVLGLRTLLRGVQPHLGSEALLVPVISVCCTRSLRSFMNNAPRISFLTALGLL